MVKYISMNALATNLIVTVGVRVSKQSEKSTRVSRIKITMATAMYIGKTNFLGKICHW